MSTTHGGNDPRNWHGEITVLVVSLGLALMAGLTIAPASAAAFVSAATSNAMASTQAAKTSFAFYAHRGHHDAKHTENTMPAFRQAHRLGAEAIETDVMLTRDRRFLLMHDPTLNRTTTCVGRVERRPLGWIRQNCRGHWAGERLPTAGQLLVWAARKRLKLILELKPGTRWASADVLRLHTAIRAHGMERRVIIHSFSAKHLRLVEEAAPALHTQYITNNLKQVEVGSKHFDGVNVWARFLTKRLVRRLHAAGLLVHARVSNSSRQWAKIRGVGAGRVVTDSTELATRWLRKGRH